MKSKSLLALKDTPMRDLRSDSRDTFELKMDLLGEAIRKARKERNLTQAELGKLVGVQRAQISKLENSLTDARFLTIVKVFTALNAKVNFQVELVDRQMDVIEGHRK